MDSESSGMDSVLEYLHFAQTLLILSSYSFGLLKIKDLESCNEMYEPEYGMKTPEVSCIEQLQILTSSGKNYTHSGLGSARTNPCPSAGKECDDKHCTL
jgi:hypothetical protein